MKYKIIECDLARPSAQSITVPLNSQYGIAVSVKDNGTSITVPTGGLKVGGFSPTETVSDLSLFKFDSGARPKTDSKDVKVTLPPTVKQDIATSTTYTATKITDTSYRASLRAFNNYLSSGAGMPEQITVSPDNLDFSAKYRKVKDGVAGDWTPYGGTSWRITHTKPDNTRQIITKSGDKWMSYVGGQYVYFDQITLNTATDYIGFASNTNVTDTEPFDAEVVQTISLDTKDAKIGAFNLVVVETDLGYFDGDGKPETYKLEWDYEGTNPSPDTSFSYAPKMKFSEAPWMIGLEIPATSVVRMNWSGTFTDLTTGESTTQDWGIGSISGNGGRGKQRGLYGDVWHQSNVQGEPVGSVTDVAITIESTGFIQNQMLVPPNTRMNAHLCFEWYKEQN